MDVIFRTADSRITHVVGPFVMVIGVLAGIAAIVLSVVMETAGFLALFIPAALALGGGAFILRGARRSRMHIDSTGFTWAGFLGQQQSVRWDALHRIAPPTSGDRRLVALALLRDGTTVPVRALWEPPTLPSALTVGPNHAEVYGTLVTAHQRWLAARR